MKKLLILLFSILISFNSYSVKLDFSSDTFCHKSPKAQLRNGLYYLPNQQKPYSGENLCVYLSNGQYYILGEVKNGLKTGEWTYWKKNGQREKVEYYKDGKIVGNTKIYYYDNGQIRSETNYKDGNQDGKFTYWKKNGQKKYEGNFKDGKLDGKRAFWHENGQIKYEQNFKDYIPDGNWNAWHENGLQSGEGFFKDGTGSYIEFFENNQKSFEVNYKDGAGKWTWWHENGQKEEELIYKDGKEVSKTKYEYYGNGQIQSKVNYKNEKLVNETKYEYYGNGQKRSEVNYKDDKLDGKHVEWYENGQIKYESNYKNGKCISGYCYEKAERLAKEKAERLAKEKAETELKSLYVKQIAARVRNNWRFQGYEDNWSCDVYILQDINGTVESVGLQSCHTGNSTQSKNNAFKNSVERAIYKTSPLPIVPDENIFDKEIHFEFIVTSREVQTIKKTERKLKTELQEEEDLEIKIAKEDILNELKVSYINQIASRVKSYWRYQGAEDNWNCQVYILQNMNGVVESVNLQSCEIDNSAKAKSFKDSIERAVYKSSPLPTAPDESVFDREIFFDFRVN